VDYYHDTKHKAFPIRLFRLLAGHRLDDVLGLPPCAWDPWTEAFVQRHSLLEASALGEVALAELRLHALVATLNIAPLETKHASIRRRLLSHSLQTRPYSFQELSAEFFLDQLRHSGVAWQLEGKSSQGHKEATGQAGDAGRKRHSHGGAWRAFVREQSLGKPGLPNGKELAELYRALPDEEMQRLKKLGDKAREQGATSLGSSSFGPRSRDIARRQAKQASLGAASQAIVTTGPPDGTAGLSMGHMCDVAIREAWQPGRADTGSLPDVLRVARASLRGQLLAQRLPEKRAAEALTQWEAKQGAEVLQNVMDKLPRLGALATALQPQPGQQPLMSLRIPLERSAAVAQAVHQAARRSNLGSCLQSQWQIVHKPILHDESEQIHEDAPPRAPACRSLGMCTCGAEGRAMDQMRSKFYKLSKLAFPRQSSSRKLLQDKMVVAKIIPSGAAIEDDSPWAMALQDEVGPAAPQAATTAVSFWHIGFTRFSPYGFSFRELTLQHEEHHESGLYYHFEAHSSRCTRVGFHGGSS